MSRPSNKPNKIKQLKGPATCEKRAAGPFHAALPSFFVPPAGVKGSPEGRAPLALPAEGRGPGAEPLALPAEGRGPGAEPPPPPPRAAGGGAAPPPPPPAACGGHQHENRAAFRYPKHGPVIAEKLPAASVLSRSAGCFSGSAAGCSAGSAGCSAGSAGCSSGSCVFTSQNEVFSRAPSGRVRLVSPFSAPLCKNLLRFSGKFDKIIEDSYFS